MCTGFFQVGRENKNDAPPHYAQGGGAKLYLPLPHVHTNDYESYTKF